LLAAAQTVDDQSAGDIAAISDDELTQLRNGEQRVAQWLQVQADIERHTLPRADLSAMAQ
jgi:hypothetical protein